MSEVKKYSAGTKGRDIVDDVVIGNASNNSTLYAEIENNPGYYGAVNIGVDDVKLSTITSKKDLVATPIIQDIIVSAEHLQLDDSDAAVKVLDGEKIDVKHTHKAIVAFIKACVAGSVSTSGEFSAAVADFVKELMQSADNLCLPLLVNTDSKIGEVVVGELNDYLKKLCTANNIHFTSQLIEKKGKGSIKELIDSAKG